MSTTTLDDPQTGADAHIAQLRRRLDEIDSTIIKLWQERAGISKEVGATRVASGGTRLVLSREREILDRFREALGADGTQLGLLILRAGRGPLRTPGVTRPAATRGPEPATGPDAPTGPAGRDPR
jgi:chorismate mutase